MMSNQAGIWIDHKRAILVTIDSHGEQVLQIESESGTELGDSHHSKRDFVPENKLDRKAAIMDNQFFDKVIGLLDNAATIFVFGPGDAKTEFRKRFESSHRKGRIDKIETADKLTVPQVAAHVRQHFLVETELKA